MDGCKASSVYGIDDIVITDVDGSLNPSGDSEGTPGAFVSSFPHMTEIFGDTCVEFEGNCMSYCPNVCLRTVTFGVEQFGTENVRLVVTSKSFVVSAVVCRFHHSTNIRALCTIQTPMGLHRCQ